MVDSTCRHYVTVDVTDWQRPSELQDPEGLLDILRETVPDARYVTLVFDVDRSRRLWLQDIQPHISYDHGMKIVSELRDSGVLLWFAEEHAAYTEHGWIDVEALEGEPMPKPHSSHG